MGEKVLQDLNDIRREYNRLKYVVYDDLKELYEENNFLKRKVDAIDDAHQRNTILFLVLLIISFAYHLYFFRQNR